MYLKSKKVSPSWHSNFLFLFTNYLMIDLYVIVINCVSNVFFTNIISILPKIIKVNKTEVLSPNIRTQQSHRQKLKKRKLMLIRQYIVHHNSKVCWLFLVLCTLQFIYMFLSNCCLFSCVLVLLVVTMKIERAMMKNQKMNIWNFCLFTERCGESIIINWLQ